MNAVSAGSIPRSSSSRSLSLIHPGPSQSMSHSGSGTATGQEEWSARNLGPGYQEIQKRTLTKWVNVQLSKVDDRIENMETDLRDGTRMLKLLSVLSKEPVPKPEKGKMRIHQLSNVVRALAFLENQLGEEVLRDIGNEAIVDGDMKRTISLLFSIMLRYQIQVVLEDESLQSSQHTLKNDSLNVPQLDFNVSSSLSTTAIPTPPMLSSTGNTSTPFLTTARRKRGRSMNGADRSASRAAEAKLALLRWVQQQLEDYISAQIIPAIQDFSRSWRSGVAFSLLIHRYDPQFIPELFDSWLRREQWNKDTWRQLLGLAFDVAEQKMGIPKYLEPSDLADVDYPHEPSVMMYVSEYYKVMSSAQREEKDDVKAQKERARRELIDNLMNDLGIGRASFDYYNQAISTINVESEENDTKMERPTDMEELEQMFMSNMSAINSFRLLDATTTDAVDQHLQALEALERSVNDGISALDTLLIKSDDDSQLPSKVQELKEKWQRLLEINDPKKNALQELRRDISEGKSDEIQQLSQQTKEIETQLSRLQNLLENAKPKKEDDSSNQTALHPLEATEEISKKYEADISRVSNEIDLFEKDTWPPFQQLVDSIGQRSPTYISVALDPIVKHHQHLLDELQHAKDQCTWFARSTSFAVVGRAVEEETEIVRKTMYDTRKPVTDDAILNLESRVEMVHSTIKALRTEYSDLVDSDSDDSSFADYLQKLHNTYEAVRDWVDQVRVWFTEAKRIRQWIAERIDIIIARNAASEYLDPLNPSMDVSDENIQTLHREHEILRQEVEQFDTDDMARLRTHVKTLTVTERDKDLSPADTSTIEITLTTLNMLNRLKQLVSDRHMLLSMSLSRKQWENQFADAVEWIAATDKEITHFLLNSARWSVKSRGNTEAVVNTLVALELKITEFDQGAYSQVLDAYQELEDLNNEATGDQQLPEHLRKRQEGFEEAFADMMKRSNFCRKVVEQHLSMVEVTKQFRQLRSHGEALRQLLMETPVDSNDNQATVDEEAFFVHVQEFKDKSAYFVSNYAAHVPYPSAPEMTTAIGVNDAHDNQVANESIRSEISAYGMSLALIADGLDQLLDTRYSILSLQRRAKEACAEMARIRAWMEERSRNLKRSAFDLCSQQEFFVIEDEELVRLEKERDNTLLRLSQIEEEDLTSILQSVQQLETDIDVANTSAIDRGSIVTHAEKLMATHQELRDLLQQSGRDIELLKKQLAWQSQWTKTNHAILALARKLWDFAGKKARYDLSRDDPENPSYDQDGENMQTLQSLQGRVAEIQDRHMNALLENYELVCEGFEEPSLHIPQFIVDKQASLQNSFDELKRLSNHTSELLIQRSSITEFLLRVQDATRSGGKLKDVCNKFTRRISDESNDANLLEARVKEFQLEVDKIWSECGRPMPYPKIDTLAILKQIQPKANASKEHDHEIASLLKRKYSELEELRKQVDRLFATFQKTREMYLAMQRYDSEASELNAWIENQRESLRQQRVDIAAESSAFKQMTESDLSTLNERHRDLISTVKHFEETQIKDLHDNVAAVLQDKTVSLDVSGVAHSVAKIMEGLEIIKRELADHQVSLEAAFKRLAWEKDIDDALVVLDTMNEKLKEFNANKTAWAALEDFSQEHADRLRVQWKELEGDKIQFKKSILPQIEVDFKNFSAQFARLAHPIATPDHIEARMDSLSRSFARFDENTDKQMMNLELDLLKRRARLEARVQEVLSGLAQQGKQLDEFVESRARWYPGIQITDDDEHLLRSQWANHSDQFSAYCSTDIEPVESEFEALRQDCSVECAWLLSEGFMRKLQQIRDGRSRQRDQLQFANQVVSQRCLMTAFSFRVAQLEQSAELIREEFASKGEIDNVESYKEQQERLQRFKSGIDDIRENLASIIPFPSRSGVMDDETTNSVIRETMQTQSRRLDELYRSLQELLETKEKHSRKKLALQSYQMEYETCKEWIASRQQMLGDAKGHQNDLDRMREGLRTVSTIESTMQAQGNVFDILQASFNKYMATLAEDKEQIGKEEQQQRFAKLEQEWQHLFAEATNIKASLADTLKVSETLHKGTLLVEALIRLRDTVVSADAATVKDDELTQWQEDINKLEAQDYVELQRASREIPDNEEIKQKLDEAAELTSEIRTVVTKLYDSVNVLRLYNTYDENAATLQTRIRQISELVKSALQNTLSCTLESGVVSIDTPRELRSQVEDCKESYDDLCGYYAFIGKQTTLSSQVQAKQSEIETGWKTLQESVVELQKTTTQLANQARCYEKLLAVYQELLALKESVQTCKAPTMEYLSDAEQNVQQLRESVKDATNVADGISTNEHNDLVIRNQVDAISITVDDLQKLISKLKNTLEKAKLLEAVRDRASEILQALAPHIDTLCNVKKAPETVDFDKMIQNSSEISTKAKQILDGCQDDYKTVIQSYYQRLQHELGCTAEEMDEILKPVADSMDKLDKAIQVENHRYQEMKSANQHSRQLQDVFAQLDSVASTIESLGDTDLTALEDTKAQFQSMEEAYEAIAKQQVVLFDSLKASSFDDQRLDTIMIKISKDSKNLEGKMASARQKLLEAGNRIYTASKYSKAVSKLRETQNQIDALKDRLSVIQVSSGKSTTQRDLCEIKQEAQNISLVELDTLLAQVSLSDEIHQHYQKLKFDHEELKELIDARLEDLNSQSSISEFLQIATDLEECATKLATAVEDAAPHHAAIVNNKFSKPDLQGLLKALVAAYKQHEPVMTSTVAKLKAEAAKHDNDERVSTRLNQLLSFCNKVKASAAARERELQTCISQLDHEFFTKLAAAKSTKRNTRKQQQQTSSNLAHQQQPPPLPIPRRPSSQLGNANGNRLRQSHTPAVVSRPSKTPRPPSRTVSRTPYVPDPKNELDVELGRIVNETPYRVKVKMVPGEVGKYWIGDVNPRLVYCRILSSKLVMVRVGGGWVELSKFLRDHKMNEGNVEEQYPASTVSSSSSIESSGSTPFQSTLLRVSRCVSPSGRVTLRGGGGDSGAVSGQPSSSSSDNNSLLMAPPTRSSSRSSSKRSSKSPVPRGYVDGDRFIRIDEAGNQISAKLTKAEDNAKMPMPPRKNS